MKPIFPSQELNATVTGYKLIGLPAFSDTEDDKNINWEDYFGLKNALIVNGVPTGNVLTDDWE